MQRKYTDIQSEGSALELFLKALYASSEEEWQSFTKEYSVTFLQQENLRRLFSDASGLVRSEFDDWVLGKEAYPIDPETTYDKLDLLGRR